MRFGPIAETPAIWAEDNNGFAYNFKAEHLDGPRPMTKFIRADLVEKLKGYAVHSVLCREQPNLGPALTKCTCGLTELLKEME